MSKLTVELWSNIVLALPALLILNYFHKNLTRTKEGKAKTADQNTQVTQVKTKTKSKAVTDD